MKNIRRKIALTLGVLASAWVMNMLVACHTVQGAGEDVSAAGNAVSNTAEDVAPY